VTEQPPSEAKEPTRPPFLRRVLDDIVHGNSVVVTILAIVIALFLGGLLIAFSDPAVLPKFGYFFAAPGDALSAAWDSVAAAYSALFKGSIVDPSDISAYINGSGTLSEVFYPICSTINQATPLILAGLAVAIPFQAGMFNIGAQGQIVVGAILAGYLGFALQLPIVLHLLVALLGGFVGGAVWGWIAGWLKARTGAHEVITTIMLNFIVLALLNYLVAAHLKVADSLHTAEIHAGALPRMSQYIAAFHGSAASVVLFIAALATALTWWFLFRTRRGFELRAAGLQPAAAEYGGVDVRGVWWRAMTLSGALAGIGGLNFVLGYKHYYEDAFASGAGFLGIAVAIVGRNNPIGVALAALVFATLSQGGLAVNALVPKQMVDVLQAVVIIAVAASVPEVRRVLRMSR
jgi:general nucleoside transport system permease protein